MIYQSGLIGIQRRMNRILVKHGYRLKAKQVPVVIQKAHKVSANEKRWGFEKKSKAERLDPVFAEIMKDPALIRKIEPTEITDEQLKGLFDISDLEL